MINDLLSVHTVFWVNSGWFVLYLIPCFAFLYKRHRFDITFRCLGTAMLLVIVLMYNPFTVFFLKKYMYGYIEYSRIGWSLLLIPVISLYFMSIYSARKKHLIVLGGLLLLLTCKNGLYYRIPENSYKVSQEAVEIVEIMDENKLGDDKSIPIAYLCPITSNLTSNMTHYDEVYYGLSSYTSRYYVLITLGNIDKIKAGYDLPYVVICKDDDTLWLEKNGYILEGETETTKVYKHYTIE